MAEKTAPAHELIVRNVRGACWANRGPDGRVWYSTRIERLYTDDKGVRRTAQTFGRDDLPVVALVAGRLWEWVLAAGGESAGGD